MTYKMFLHEEFVRAFQNRDFDRMSEIQSVQLALGYIDVKIF